MKQLYSFFPAFVFSAFVVLFIANQSPLPTSPISRGESMQALSEGEEIGGALAYEFQRLRDPETEKIPSNIRRLELEYAATLPGYISPSPLSLRRGVGSEALSSTLNWQSRGPWNVGGRTRAFAIDATNPNKFLAGSTSGGMWFSTNGGTSWTQSWNTVHQSVSCIAQDRQTNTWYIGTGEGYGQSASGGSAYYLGNGMYKSTDGGATWNVLVSTSSGTPQTFENVWDIIWNTATNPADTTTNGTVYAATYGAIWKSINGGTSWAVVKGSSVSSPFSYFTDVAVSPSGVIYATLSSDGSTSQKGIWRSPDGITWTRISNTATGFPTTYGRVKIGISPSDENQVYFWAGTTTGFGTPDTNFLGDVEWNSLWKYDYDTSGGKWFDLSANLPTTGGPHDKQHVQGGYDMFVKFHPTDTAVVFLGGTNIYRSDDGFFSSDSTKFIGGYKKSSSIPYTIDTYLNHHPDQHELIFDAGNNILYSSNDGGIYKSTNFMADSVVWTSLNNGYLTSMFYTVALDHATPNDSTIIGGLQDNNSWFVNSSNPQATWKSIFFGDGSYCAIANNKLNYYFSIQNGKMQKMQLDASGNVLMRRRIDPIGGTGYQFINPYVLDQNNNNVMYLAGGKNLWRNDNLNSITLLNPSVQSGWDSISTGWTMFPDTLPIAWTLVNGILTGAKITALAVSKNPANILYYGTSNRRVYRVDGANIGTPTAVDITGLVSPNQFPAGANVSCIAIDPNDAGNVMVAFSNYNVYSIFYSSNADSTVPTWTKVAGNLEANSSGTGNGSSVRWVSIMPVSDGIVYLVATSTGLYATDTLLGTSTLWAQQGASTIGNSICDMIDFRTSDGLVAVATHSRGVFTTNITSVNDVLTANELQAQSSMFNVFPNPSNGIFNLKISQFEDLNIKDIKIYNSQGERIYSAVNSQINSSSNFQIDLCEAKSGVYYCVLKSGEATQTKKMILIK